LIVYIIQKQLRILTSVIISSSGSESSLEEAVAPVDPCALLLTLCREGDEGKEGRKIGGREDKEGNTEKCIPVEVMGSIHNKKATL